MRRCMNSLPAGQIYTGCYSPGPAWRSLSSHQSLTNNQKTQIRSKRFQTRTPQEPLPRPTCAHTWWWKGLKNRYVSAINVAIAQNVQIFAQVRSQGAGQTMWQSTWRPPALQQDLTSTASLDTSSGCGEHRGMHYTTSNFSSSRNICSTHHGQIFLGSFFGQECPHFPCMHIIADWYYLPVRYRAGLWHLTRWQFWENYSCSLERLFGWSMVSPTLSRIFSIETSPKWPSSIAYPRGTRRTFRPITKPTTTSSRTRRNSQSW